MTINRVRTQRCIWEKVFKNDPSTICGRQPFKNLKWYGLLKERLSSTNFISYILCQERPQRVLAVTFYTLECGAFYSFGFAILHFMIISTFHVDFDQHFDISTERRRALEIFRLIALDLKFSNLPTATH